MSQWNGREKIQFEYSNRSSSPYFLTQIPFGKYDLTVLSANNADFDNINDMTEAFLLPKEVTSNRCCLIHAET